MYDKAGRDKLDALTLGCVHQAEEGACSRSQMTQKKSSAGIAAF
ncbi:Uncharacterised protein [Yokenella regensburgei]|nr:Uncharacterised protein [Yokenella regensburgei]